MPSKTKRYIVLVFKIIFVLVAYYFVFERIYNSSDINDLKLYFSNITAGNLLILTLIFLLMFLNWSIESVKWKYTMSKLENLSFFQSFKAVWTGVTTGTATPNRVGEFGGRILFVSKENRLRATSLTLYADLSQFIATLLFGIIGFFLFSIEVSLNENYIQQFENLIWIFSFIIILITTFLFFYFSVCIRFLQKIPKLYKMLHRFVPADNLNMKFKLSILFFSMIRYLVFNFQFYLSLLFFDIDISLANSLIASSSMYLSLNILPNIPFSEIGLRSSFSLLFFGYYTDKHTAVVLASLIVYIVNIAIPTLIGSWFLILKKRYLLSTTFKKEYQC